MVLQHVHMIGGQCKLVLSDALLFWSTRLWIVHSLSMRHNVLLQKVMLWKPQDTLANQLNQVGDV